MHHYCENAVLAVSVLGLALAVAFGSMVASRNLHTGLLSQVMRCPMSFFDTTPLGRIVNRFSKDIDILDTNIPQFSQNFLITFAPLVSTIIVISYSTPIFIAVAIPLILIFLVIQVTKKFFTLRIKNIIFIPLSSCSSRLIRKKNFDVRINTAGVITSAKFHIEFWGGRGFMSLWIHKIGCFFIDFDHCPYNIIVHYCPTCCNFLIWMLNIGSRALSFSDPYIHFACLSVRHSVIRSVILSFCLSVRNFGAKYLGNEAR